MAQGGLAGQCLPTWALNLTFWGVLALVLVISMIWGMLLKSVSTFSSVKWD